MLQEMIKFITLLNLLMVLHVDQLMADSIDASIYIYKYIYLTYQCVNVYVYIRVLPATRIESNGGLS